MRSDKVLEILIVTIAEEAVIDSGRNRNPGRAGVALAAGGAVDPVSRRTRQPASSAAISVCSLRGAEQQDGADHFSRCTISI